MNCRECQDRLFERFDGKNLPVDLAGHMELCAECRTVWADLHALGEELGDNAAFYPEPQEAKLVAEAVDREIRAGSSVTVLRPMLWLRYVTVAAAVVLVSVTATIWRSDRSAPVAVNTDSSGMSADSTYASSEEELPGNAVSTLLEDYASRASFSAGEDLLGDLTEEEAVFLETELKAGDLL